MRRPLLAYRIAIEAGLVPALTVETAAAADAADHGRKVAVRKAGRHEHAGLPCLHPLRALCAEPLLDGKEITE